MLLKEIVLKIIPYNSPEYHESFRIREEILMKPFGKSYNQVPEDMAQEPNRIHFAGLLDNQVVATASLIDQGSTAWLRSVAVIPQLQSQGIGKQLLAFIESYATQKGYQELYCHARDTAVNFYLKNGWRTEGGYFQKVGIAHIAMRKKLAEYS